MLDSSGLVLPALPDAESHIAFAARRLRQALVACEIEPGTYCHEAGLAERFGLGRAAIRVALTELAVAGFVSRHPRQGWRAAEVDGALATAIIEARARLEPALVAKAPGDGEREALQNLRGVIEAVSCRDDPAARAMLHRSHRQALDGLARAAGGFVEGWLRDLWDHAERLVRALDLAGQALPPADPRPLLDALLNGDLPAAARALQAEQAEFKAGVAAAFLTAGHLGRAATQTSARRRRSARPAFDQPLPTRPLEETSR